MEEETEGIDRFNKIVSEMGLYVPPDEQMLIDQNMLGADENGTYPAVHAYVNEDCYKNKRGFLLACIDELCYMCLETKYENEQLYCNGSGPAWSYNDKMLIEHLSEMIKDYKLDLNRKRKAAILGDFE